MTAPEEQQSSVGRSIAANGSDPGARRRGQEPRIRRQQRPRVAQLGEQLQRQHQPPCRGRRQQRGVCFSDEAPQVCNAFHEQPCRKVVLLRPSSGTLTLKQHGRCRRKSELGTSLRCKFYKPRRAPRPAASSCLKRVTAVLAVSAEVQGTASSTCPAARSPTQYNPLPLPAPLSSSRNVAVRPAQKAHSESTCKASTARLAVRKELIAACSVNTLSTCMQAGVAWEPGGGGGMITIKTKSK